MDTQKEESAGFGTMIGIIIILIILVIGGYYFAKQRIEKSREFQASLSEGEISTTTLSDDIPAIENTASSMNFDNLGTGIDNL